MLANTEEIELLANFFQGGTRLRYPKDDFLIRPGETPPGVFYIEEGLVKSYDITRYGEENLLIIRKPGELLGITYAVTHEDRGVIYSALIPTSVRLVSHTDFAAFLHNHPRACLPVVDLITSMYRQHSERIMTLEYRTVRERLASFLLSMSRRFGKNFGDAVTIAAPLKQTDIASSINATRETTSRALTELEHKGIISHTQSVITLKNPAALQQLLGAPLRPQPYRAQP